MPQSTFALRSAVTRRQTAAVPVDADERAAQAAHHQAAENAAVTAQEAATATEPEKSGSKLKREANALQSAFLGAHLNRPVTVFTINGIRLGGKLRQFDQFTLLLQGPDGVDSLIFKHAITTISPAGR